jgi:hypothetical protein
VDRHRAASTSVAIPLLLGGCGGDEALTRSEWIAEAETICARAAASFDALDPDDFGSRQDFARAVDDQFDRRLADLRALDPPASDEGTIDRWLDLQEQLAEAWATFLASDGGQKATEAFTDTAEPISTRADRLIRTVGADGCAVDPDR